MADKKALIGLHDRLSLEAAAESFELYSYVVDKVSNISDMLEKAKSQKYQAYLMDVNLGKPGSYNIDPAIQVYTIVKPYVDAGESKFLAISGNEDVVKEAKEKGIPVEDKFGFSLDDFLK